MPKPITPQSLPPNHPEAGKQYVPTDNKMQALISKSGVHPKTHEYAVMYLRTGCPVTAYREVFGCHADKLNELQVKAWSYHEQSDVQSYVKDLRPLVDENIGLSAEDKRRILHQVVSKAGLQQQYRVVISAITELNKMDGDHATEKKEVTVKGDVETLQEAIAVLEAAGIDPCSLPNG